MKLPLSVSVISYNEERIIEKMLESVFPIADEIIILDSYSKDNTKEIAKKYGAKIFEKQWTDFVTQKNDALNLCSNDWVLCLDCDEILTEKLREDIKRSITENKFNGFYLKRKTVYLGKLLNYAWQPDLNLRLVNKAGNPRWIGQDVHESLVIDGEVGILNGDLLHYSYSDIKHHFEKTIALSKLSANAYYKKGKRFRALNLFLNPIIAFIRLYFINKGILDGKIGFIAAVSSFFGTFLKYAFY
ncbi:MAG: glycosyltransferase family 2 protein [Candidatus Kapaibacteriota bacterium]